MFCKKCGAQLLEETKFCPFCGQDLTEEVKSENVKVESVEVTAGPKQAKCWAIFAKVAHILSIISVIGCWIPFLGLFAGLSTGSCGIVFAILGKHSPEGEKSFSKSLTLNIIGTVVGFISYLVFIVIMVMLAEGSGDFNFDYYYY